MSKTLGNLAATQFEAEVKQAYQERGGKLRDTVRVKMLQNAKTHTFNKMGKGQASERTSVQTPIPVMDVSNSTVTVTTKNYTASELTDIFKDGQTPVDERLELAQLVAKTLGRQEDQLIIDALDASSTSLTVADSISGSTANLTMASLRESAKLLDQNNVPDEDRALVIHPSGLHHLLEDNTVTSSDYNSIRALIAGDLDTYYGFRIIKIGTMSEGGLPVPSTNKRTSFAYHKMAVGMAVNMDLRVTVDWDPTHGAWRTTGWLSANAVAIDDEGIVKITTDES